MKMQNICTNTGNGLEDAFIAHPVAFVILGIFVVIAGVIYFAIMML